MTPKQFIEKAIDGGWVNPRDVDAMREALESPILGKLGQCSMFLDPKSWQAVGKAEDWGMVYRKCGAKKMLDCSCDIDSKTLEEWKYNMHNMIDALCEGKTIEQFLETL